MNYILKCQHCGARINSEIYNDLQVEHLSHLGFNLSEELKEFELTIKEKIEFLESNNADNEYLTILEDSFRMAVLTPKYILDNQLYHIVDFKCFHCSRNMYDYNITEELKDMWNKETSQNKLPKYIVKKVREDIIESVIKDVSVLKADKDVQDKYLTMVRRLTELGIVKVTDDIWNEYLGYSDNFKVFYDSSVKILNRLKDIGVVDEYLESNKKNKLIDLIDNDNNLELFDTKEFIIFLDEIKTIIRRSGIIKNIKNKEVIN